MAAVIPILLLAPWICISDIRFHRIPNVALLVLWVLNEIEAISLDRAHFEAAQETLIALFAISISAKFLFRGAIGMGDVKLMTLLGFAVRSLRNSLSVLVIACIFGLLWALFSRKSAIPFAPALIGAALLELLTQ